MQDRVVSFPAGSLVRPGYNALMVEFRRSRTSVAAATVAALLLASAAWAQPPVARPQPPPKAPQASTPAAAPPQPGSTTSGKTGTTTTTAGPSTTTTPSGTSAAPTARPVSPTAAPAAPVAIPPVAAGTTGSAPVDNGPDPTVLGVQLFPNAQYFSSYDAGGAGQRFYLYGTSQPFADVVTYYRTILKDKGELVFDAPATHMFEVGKFRDDQVAFPPGVTVKDYTYGGSAGLTNPRSGATPQAFRTVIQIVPPATLPIARPR
jgi:hypothetical protein